MTIARHIRRWLGERPELVLVAAATFVRAVFLLGTGVPRGGDAALYLRIARSVADGHPATSGYPLQALYGVALSPAYVDGIGVDRWVMALHLVLGVATVVVLYRLARLIVGPGMAMGVGAVAAVWPTFIYWTRFIETETLFLFLLSCFLLVCTRQLLTPSTNWKRWLSLAAAAAGVSVCRSVGIFIVWAALLVLIGASVRRRRTVASASRVVLATVALSFLVVAAVLLVPTTRDSILKLRNVSDALWSSTRSFHSSLEHARRRIDHPREIRSLPADAQSRELSERALQFIRDHPADYASRAGIRFANFWFPWLTADWTYLHLGLDMVLSVALITLALGSLLVVPAGPRRQVVVLLVAVAAAQALLVTFGELDSDGRYRVPVELCLLLLAAMTLDGLLAHRKPGIERRDPTRPDVG